MKEKSTIFVIDDDPGVRAATLALLQKHQHDVEVFDSAETFLSAYHEDMAGCIILDISMPGMNGLELQEELVSRNILTPIIFISGFANISWAVQAMKRGAVNFLEKPYDEMQLIQNIQDALDQDNLNRRINLNCNQIIERYKNLTNREKEVVEYLVFGHEETTNKLIAKKMSISHRTVEEYRAAAMKKMDAKSLRELISMILICKLHNKSEYFLSA